LEWFATHPSAIHRVTVNAIAPGTINTPIRQDIMLDMLDQFSAADATRRLGTPCDFGAMAAYPCSPEADLIMGVAVSVDGGWSIAWPDESRTHKQKRGKRITASPSM